MKNKISIYLNMIIICLSLCVISIGVYSLTSANLTISGSLGYVYHDKSPYTITATIQDYTTTEDGTLQTSAISSPLTIGEAEPDTTAGTEFTKISLTDDQIYFKGKGWDAKHIEVLVTVKNNEDTQKAVVLLFDDITGLGYTRKVASGKVTIPTSITENHSSAIILSKGEQTTFRLTLKQSIKKTNLSIAKSDFNIQVSVADYDESNFTASQTDTTTTANIKYTLNGLKSWSVAGDGVSGDVTFEPIIQGLPVNKIAQSGFYFVSISSIKIENSVTDILFKGCAADRGECEVYIPGSVVNVEGYAFAGHSPLNLLSNNIFNFTTLSDYSFGNKENSNGISFTMEIQNNELEKIPYGCFNYLNITEIIIPSSVTRIIDYAFYHCPKLESVTISNGVTSIEERAFQSCSALTSITIPSSVTSIAQFAFAQCSALTSIIIPSSVTSIGTSAFYACSALASITILSNETSKTSIGGFAFSDCIALTSITIPSSVTSIDTYAFYKCTNLNTITFEGTTPPTFDSEYSPFYDCSALTAIYVPSASVDAYKTALTDIISDTSIVQAIST